MPSNICLSFDEKVLLDSWHECRRNIIKSGASLVQRRHNCLAGWTEIEILESEIIVWSVFVMILLHLSIPFYIHVHSDSSTLRSQTQSKTIFFSIRDRTRPASMPTLHRIVYQQPTHLSMLQFWGCVWVYVVVVDKGWKIACALVLGLFCFPSTNPHVVAWGEYYYESHGAV